MKRIFLFLLCLLPLVGMRAEVDSLRVINRLPDNPPPLTAHWTISGGRQLTFKNGQTITIKFSPSYDKEPSTTRIVWIDYYLGSRFIGSSKKMPHTFSYTFKGQTQGRVKLKCIIYWVRDNTMALQTMSTDFDLYIE